MPLRVDPHPSAATFATTQWSIVFAAGTGSSTAARDALEFLLGHSVDGGYAAVAARLGMTEGAAKMTVTRLRERYRRLLRAEVAQTLANPAEVDNELRHLLAILRGA